MASLNFISPLELQAKGKPFNKATALQTNINQVTTFHTNYRLNLEKSFKLSYFLFLQGIRNKQTLLELELSPYKLSLFISATGKGISVFSIETIIWSPNFVELQMKKEALQSMPNETQNELPSPLIIYA